MISPTTRSPSVTERRAPFRQCGVVLEQMQVREGQAEAFREWYAEEYLPAPLPPAGDRVGRAAWRMRNTAR